MTRLDALADPFRLAIARHLAARPAATAPEVASAVGVHLNTARAHLAALVDAGIADRVSESGGRPGRPAVRYRIREGWAPDGEELLSLSSLLATAIMRLHPDPDELRDIAMHWGRRWAAAGGEADVERRLSGALSRLGYGVRVLDDRVALSACPCPLVAPDRPELVCALADAVVDGVLEGSGLRAAERNHDPARRTCTTSLEAA